MRPSAGGLWGSGTEAAGGSPGEKAGPGDLLRAGSIQLGTPVDPGGSAAVMNSLPLAGIVETLRGEGLPCSLSVSAGSYVCNDLYYTLLSHQKELGYRGLFVHVPSADRVDPETAADILVRLIREIG